MTRLSSSELHRIRLSHAGTRSHL